MSPTVDALKVCPTCHEITDPSDLECHNCGELLKIATNKYFAAPDYIFHQKHTLTEQLELDKLKPGDKAYDEKISDIQEHLDRWCRECHREDRLAAITDAYMLLSHILFSRATADEMKQLALIAKKIGDLGVAIDHYIKAGGTTLDRKARPIRPDFGDDHWNQASAFAGGNQ